MKIALQWRYKNIRQLESSGAEVLPLCADVSDEEQLGRVLDEVRSTFGTIHGVAHAAGAVDDGLIAMKSPQDADRVLRAKVRGAIALDTQTESDSLDFFLMYSSTSTTIGAAGQIDYVAANAVLNAIADSRRTAGKPYTVAINWGVWASVGMAVKVATQQGLTNDIIPVGEDVSHPMLGRCILRNDQQTIFSATYSVEDYWFLKEHRIKDGKALLPGTGYLEIARAAFTEVASEYEVAILNLGFLEPLEVSDGSRREVRVSLDKSTTGYDFKVTSREIDAGSAIPNWREHATATLESRSPVKTSLCDLEVIRARCINDETVWEIGEQNTHQEDYLDFGPRWKNVRRILFGDVEVIGDLELDEEYVDDLNTYCLHPALMDLATSLALPIIRGFESSGLLFVPFTYDQVRIHGPLTRQITTHARYRGSESIIDDVPIFDVTIFDNVGNIVVEVSGFTTKGVKPESMRELGTNKPNEPLVSESNMLMLALTDGIKPEDGREALSRILAGNAPAQLTVSSLDLDLLIQSAAGDVKDDDTMKLARPDLDNEYEAARNAIEIPLVALWQELLGVDQIGIRDDFFELGGHSLIAIRLLARVKKNFGVDLSLATLFEARTIADFSELLERDFGIVADVISDSAKKKPRRRRNVKEWSPIVSIQSKGNLPPFFCIHGGHGNVLGFYDLTRYLGIDQPFYGVQARGVDGRRSPHQSMSSMAAEYMQEIRAIQPEGPYYLGGFSMGGEVAFEIACKLRELGQEVAFVGMLDSGNPEFTRILSRGYPRGWGRSKGTVSFSTQGWPEVSQIKRIKAFVRYTNYRLVTAIISLISKTWMISGKVLPQSLLRPYLWNTHTILVNEYLPKMYDGNITMFRASSSKKNNPDVDGAGWGRFTTGKYEEYELEGTHDIIKEPYAKKLAELLQRALHLANVEITDKQKQSD